ncbi:hypothetical protein [Streptomyces himastatinicus]|nr:hypothetical protein [Streptomyces himastatinicus]
MSESYKRKTVRWIAGAAVVAAVVGVTGCSKKAESDSGVKKKPASSSSGAGAKKGAGAADSQPSKPRQATAEEAVASWVTAVVKNKPKEGCLVMGVPAHGSTPAKVGSPERCDSDAPDIRQMHKSVKMYHKSFTPKQSTGDPKVEVAKTPATGDKVMVPADKITVDGQTLDKVMVSNSTGVKQGQLDMKVEASKIKDAWYMSNLDFNIG